MKRKSKNTSFPHQRQIKKWLTSLLIAVIVALAAWIHDVDSSDSFAQEPGEIEFYANQTDNNLVKTFSQAIENAQQSVSLIIYSLTDPTIINCLKNKANAGIPVHVVCDAKASPHIQQKLGPNIPVVRRFGPGLMHQKILVVDNATTWIGSANMTTESLKMHGNLVNAIQSERFAAAAIKKAFTLEEEGRAPPLPQEQFTIDGQKIELWFLPDCKHASLRIKELIRQAQESIRIAMFTWTRYDFVKEVVSAANRGIKVEVVIDRNQGRGSCANVVHMLEENGIPIFLSDGEALLHHKFLYVDGHTLVNGSANWTKAAFTQNDDCFIVIHDLTEEQHAKMDALWSSIRRSSSRVQ